MRFALPVCLVLSLTVNAGLVGVRLVQVRRDAGDQAAGPGLKSTEMAVETGATGRGRIVGEVDASRLTPEVVEKIGAGDVATLRDLLLACGMDPMAVRLQVRDAVNRRHEGEAVEAMMRKRGKGWWKETPNWWDFPEREEIERRREAETEAMVIGLPEHLYPWDLERWSFLPPEKRAAWKALDRAYRELEGKLPPRPWLPQEVEMYSKLQDEKRREQEALMSGEELAEHRFREEAGGFARDLAKYDITEPELRALWQANQERAATIEALTKRYGMRDPFAPLGGDWPLEAREAERRTDELYEARKVEILGADRIARGNREADDTFKGIAKVTDRFELGRERAEAVFAVIERAQRVVDEGPVDREDRERLRDAVWAEIGEQVSPESFLLIRETLGFRHYWLKPEAE